MNKTTLLSALVIAVIVIAAGLFFFFPKTPSSNPKVNSEVIAPEEIKPSETFIEYTDPAGFSFNYPDNLSLEKNETEDANTYTDLELFSKDVSGSLKLKIADSKFKSLDDWLKTNQIPPANQPKEVSLGNLKALEVKTSDRLMLGSLDQGVLFTIEIPLIEQEFWTKVYEKVLVDFSFVSPVAEPETASTYSESEVIFEGEEVVE